MIKWGLPVILLVLMGGGLWWVNRSNPTPITNNPVHNTPVNIVIPSNNQTASPVSDDSCVGMSWSEAKQIADKTEWANWVTEDKICNEITETWWINLSLKKPGCGPALIIHTDTGAADINWRCTGALPVTNEMLEGTSR